LSLKPDGSHTRLLVVHPQAHCEKRKILKLCKNCVRKRSGGRYFANKVTKNVWGRRPHTFCSLVLRNLGPQTSSGHSFCAILIFHMLVHLLAYLGEWTTITQGVRGLWRSWVLRQVLAGTHWPEAVLGFFGGAYDRKAPILGRFPDQPGPGGAWERPRLGPRSI
jgi:hypothetical protein